MPAISLPPRFDADAAAALWAEIATARGVELDGSALRHLAAAGVQVLLVADACGLARLVSVSDAGRAALVTMGADALLGGVQ